jgi:hypothetical protein
LTAILKASCIRPFNRFVGAEDSDGFTISRAEAWQKLAFLGAGLRPEAIHSGSCFLEGPFATRRIRAANVFLVAVNCSQAGNRFAFPCSPSQSHRSI